MKVIKEIVESMHEEIEGAEDYAKKLFVIKKRIDRLLMLIIPWPGKSLAM